MVAIRQLIITSRSEGPKEVAFQRAISRAALPHGFKTCQQQSRRVQGALPDDRQILQMEVEGQILQTPSRDRCLAFPGSSLLLLPSPLSPQPTAAPPTSNLLLIIGDYGDAISLMGVTPVDLLAANAMCRE